MSKLVKGSPAAKAWGTRMQKLRARKKKNPGVAYHLREAGFAHGVVRTTPDPDEKVFYAGVESAHRISASSAKRLGMNPQRTHQLTNSEADALYKYASSIRNRGKRRYAYALYEYVLGGQRGLGPDWKSYGIQIMTEQAVRMRFAELVPALMRYDENPRPRRTKKYRQGVSAYDMAVQHGFPYIRGEGRSKGGVWYNRFTKTADGSGPALYVGYNEATRRWLIEGDEPLYKDMTLEEVQKATKPPEKNPITIVGNPNPPNGSCPEPPERVSASVTGVLYCSVIEIQAEKKVKHKGFWYHPFKRKSEIQMLALDNGDLLIHSVRGTPLWKRD